MAKKRDEEEVKAPVKDPASEEPKKEEPKAPEAAEAPKEKGKKTEITVHYRDHKGEPTSRVFSKEVHGEQFAELAEEFKETNKAKLIA
jgi:hypothetical protein